MNTYLLENLKKVFSVLLITGMFAMIPYGTYAAEEDIPTFSDAVVEIIEPVSELIVIQEVNVLSATGTTTESYEDTIEPEVLDAGSESDGPSAMELPTSATTTDILQEVIPVADRAVFFVRTKIEPVEPPSIASFQNQPKLRAASKPEKIPLLVPPPFIAPGEFLIAATSTEELVEFASSTQATTSDSVIEDAVSESEEQGPASPVSDNPLPSVDAIATTTKEQGDEDSDSGANPDEESGEPESEIPIARPEEPVEIIAPESEPLI